MRITRRQLKKLVESFLNEKKEDLWICPRCGHEHKKEPKKKCNGCGLKYDDKWQGKAWKKPTSAKNENRLYHLFEQAAKFVCPKPAKSIELNTVNRDRGIEKPHIMYGPLNITEPGDYWEKIAKKWKTTEKAAKKSLCGNCVAFDISPQMEECMPGEVEEDADGGRLGYCWMHHFKCHSLRTCNTWAKGGPISTDKVSTDWFEGAKEAALFDGPHEEFLKGQESETN